MKERIKEDLNQLSDLKYKKFHSKLCPGTNNILGVRIPVLREYAKKLVRQYSFYELMEIIDNEYYEEIMLQGMIIGLQTKENWNILEREIENFISKIDNWAVCDIFCASLKITKKYKKEMWKLILKTLKSSCEFEMRFAIVMIINYYIDEEYLEQDFQLFNNIQNDDYYVKMAIAWAISICFIQFYDKTLDYLINRATISNWVYHKAIQKAIESHRITNEQKEELRKIRKER